MEARTSRISSLYEYFINNMLRFEAFINNCFVKAVINLTVGQKANLKGLGLEISKLNNMKGGEGRIAATD